MKDHENNPNAFKIYYGNKSNSIIGTIIHVADLKKEDG